MAGSTGNYNDEEGMISDINVTPLVDVVLVILIVFMITVPTMIKMKIQSEREMDLQLPSAGSAPGMTSRITDLTIDVLQDGTYRLEGDPCSLDELAERLKFVEDSNPGNVTVVVSADKRLVLQHVITALNTCNKVGIFSCRVSAVD